MFLKGTKEVEGVHDNKPPSKEGEHVKKPSIVVILRKNENQRTVVDSSYFKNTKESTIVMKEPNNFMTR